MRQGAGTVDKAILNALPTHRLLPQTGNHLGCVQRGALGPTLGHAQRCVAVVQSHQGLFTTVLSNFAQQTVHFGFQRLQSVAAGLELDAACVDVER